MNSWNGHLVESTSILSQITKFHSEVKTAELQLVGVGVRGVTDIIITVTGITSSSCIVCYTRLYSDPATVTTRLPSLPSSSPHLKKKRPA